MRALLPQVSAALVAFIGFLALQSLDEPSCRRGELVDKSRKHVQNYCGPEGWKNFVTLTFFGIDALSRNELSREIDLLLGALPAETETRFAILPKKAVVQLPHDAKRGSNIAILRDYRKEWRILDQQINRTQMSLTVFVCIHLLVIGVTLSLIPYIPRFAGVLGLKKLLLQWPF